MYGAISGYEVPLLYIELDAGLPKSLARNDRRNVHKLFTVLFP